MAYLVHEGSNVPFRSRSFFLGPCGEATFSYCHPFGRGAARSLVPPPPGLSSIKIRYDCWVRGRPRILSDLSPDSSEHGGAKLVTARGRTQQARSEASRRAVLSVCLRWRI